MGLALMSALVALVGLSGPAAAATVPAATTTVQTDDAPFSFD